jgi:hypothetical protein
MSVALKPYSTHIPIERVERAKHRPPSAQLLIGDTAKSANVRANYWNLIDRSKSEDTRNTVLIMLIIRNVVTEPFANFVTCTGERRAGNDERALAWSTSFEGFASFGAHHFSIQVV